MRLLVLSTLALLCVASAVDAAAAAGAGGVVAGRVKDALERPLPGARVRLEATDGRVIATTTADDQGLFAFSAVPPGTYALVGEKDGFDAATAIVTVTEAQGARSELALASRRPLDLQVAAKRLEEERIKIQPRIGASTYELTNRAIDTQPGGENNALPRVLLQAPGVSQDSDSAGSLHVREQMGNIQYRINGIVLPEGATLFGQSGGLSPRLASSITLLTGALPAEFGLRTTGIFDIQTKSGAFDPGGYVGMYGGSHGWMQPSAEYRGSVGRFNYFVTGDYLQNTIGISPATPGGAIHDDTRQGHAFGYFEYLLDATSKVSAILGSFAGHFQIPDRPNVSPVFTVNGVSTFDSSRVDETQLEQNYFAVLTYLKTLPGLSVQASTFARYSKMSFRPDELADLLFNGIAQRVDRSSIATGLQVDGTYVLTPTHTLNWGMYLAAEQTSVQSTSEVLPATDGAQTSDQPFRIFDSHGKTGYTYSVYLQDAWRIVPTVTINGGLRIDGLDAFTREWQLSPRLNVVWQATPTTTIHAGYARYFTPPRQEFVSTASIAKFDNTTAAAEVPVNSPVRAERAHYLDAGITQKIVTGLTVGLDGYYKQSMYHLDEGQFGAPTFLTPFNYHRADNIGIELTTSYTAGGFTAYGNLAAAQQVAKGIVSAQALFSADDLAYIHDHYIVTDHSQLITASAGLAYLWRATRVSLDLLVGSGLRRTVVHPNDATNPPYQQLDFGITHRFTLPAFGTMEARFDVINVLGKDYVLRNGTGVGIFATQFGPPRGFYGGLKKEF
ncbi:MAG TPA: TonB-dependent receptor [Candidatus Bathyarchaeia archaeon]|nr:TonB-dependent receptor [Candidatus Bathyarchaeia archaeon]